MGGDFRLGEWTVRPKRRQVERGGEAIQVKPKSMAVFECLAAAKGEPVSRNELLDAVWPGAEVTDDVLTKCIVELRKAFGDSARESRVIETIPKLGFRLVLPVEPLEEAVAAVSPSNDSNSLHSGRRLRPVVLGLATVAILLGLLMSYSGTRLWLTEQGVTLFMKSAAILSPHSLEQGPGIAVLPFVNFSGDPENEYFSDGMSVEIINRLARSDSVPVIASSSTFEFKDRFHDVREIGELLGVTHVLEGSVRRSGETIRLTVQLIDAKKGSHVWSGIYQRELGDVFAVQDEVAREIVAQVRAALGARLPSPTAIGPKTGFMRTQAPPNLEAYDLYLKGVELVTSNRPLLIEQAPGYFDRAIALESNYADAWAAKGFALAIQGAHYSGAGRIPATVYPPAVAAFRRALEIDPDHAFATGWLGVLLMINDFKWAEGMEMMERSLALNPNDAELLSVYGFYLDTLQLEGADAVLERAYRLDPFSIQTIVNRALRLQRKGRKLEAASLVETSLIEDPDGYGPNYFSAGFNIGLGRLDIAEERIAKAREVGRPVDLNLDALQWLIDSRRGKDVSRLEEMWERMQTEQLSGAVMWEGFRDEKLMERYGVTEEYIVAVFNLAIEQRHPALRSALFKARPPRIPEAEWRRIREVTGAAQFQASRENSGNEYGPPFP